MADKLYRFTNKVVKKFIDMGDGTDAERGLAADTYYLVFSNITESGTAVGVYDLIWEERP